MAAKTIVNPQVAKGGHMETIKKLILTGQAWQKGEFLTITDAGLLRGINTGALAGTGGVKYYALTDQANPGDSTTYAEVGVITPTLEFEGNCKSGTVSDANVGQVYDIDSTANADDSTVDDITVDTAGGEQALGAAHITAIASDYNRIQNAAADTNAVVRFRIPAAIIDANPTDG
jgi:hypothetical protein